MAVCERECRIDLSEFVPQSPYAELRHVLAGVVQEYDGARAQLREPRMEVMADGLIVMAAVDMKQIDAPVLEAFERVVEGHLEQGGESPVERVVVTSQFFEDGRVGPARELIAGQVSTAKQRVGSPSVATAWANAQ